MDDNLPLLAATTELLASKGYDVISACDGFEALATLRESALPDVVITDLKMPNMSGFELMAVLRKTFPSISVIARSGEFIPGDPKQAGVIADAFLGKNVGDANSDIVAAVEALISRSPIRSQPVKGEVAPAWLPRSSAGYLVLTCQICLRSFSVPTRHVEMGVTLHDLCIHCGVDVPYRIDESVVVPPAKPSTSPNTGRMTERPSARRSPTRATLRNGAAHNRRKTG